MDKNKLIGWFANAIMAGYDNANWEAEKNNDQTKAD